MFRPKMGVVFFDYDSIKCMELLKHILIVLDIVMSVAILSVHAYWGGGRRHETDRINAVSLRIQLQTAYDACQGLHPATCVGRVGSGLLFRGADYAARLGLGEPQRHCARAAQCSDAGIFRSLHR